MSTTTNIEYLRRNLLDDVGTAVWGDDELYDAIGVESVQLNGHLSRVGATAYYFESGKPFWMPPGTGSGQALVLDVLLNGSVLATAAYSIDHLLGRVQLATPSTTIEDEVTATFYACNLWEVARTALVRRLNSTAITGEKQKIRLGPLSKEVSSPAEMVLSFSGRINIFADFARRWRNQAQTGKRVRL